MRDVSPLPKRVIPGGFAVVPTPPGHNIDQMKFVLDLRRRGIMNAAVLRAMEEVPRDRFVMPAHASAAYQDRAMPIACGQTISQPFVVAYMTEQLAVGPRHHVLEVGTGSGYQAAVLSRLAARVTTIERYRTLADTAHIRLKAMGNDNVEVIHGDGMAGAPERAPFDRIIVTAATETAPQALVDQLAVDGVMVLPLGPADAHQNLVKIVRTARGVARTDLIAVRFVPLLPGEAKEL
jgi:protein-L-isoaspartate(D-aspartate) O-methyltransferase